MKLLELLSRHYLRLIFSFVLLSVITVSCKKENEVQIMNLKFPLYTYYVSEGAEVKLYIQSGNQKYAVQVGDDKLKGIELILPKTEQYHP